MTGNDSESSEFSIPRQPVNFYHLVVSCQLFIGLSGWLLVYPVMIRSKAMTGAPYKLIISLGVNDALVLLVYLCHLILSALPSSPTITLIHIQLGRVMPPLWHSFEVHLGVVAINRLVLIVFSKYKNKLYGEYKGYCWVIFCWCIFFFSAAVQPYFEVKFRNALRCIVVHEAVTNNIGFFSFAVDMTLVVLLFATYVAIAIKIHRLSKASRSAKRKEISISAQQAIVFIAYALSHIIWTVVVIYQKVDTSSPCTKYNLTIVIDLFNYCTSPIIYLIFNTILRQEVAKALGCPINQVYGMA